MTDAAITSVLAVMLVAAGASFLRRPRAISAVTLSLLLAFSEDLFRKVFGAPPVVTLLKDVAVLPLALVNTALRLSRSGVTRLDLVVIMTSLGIVALAIAQVAAGITTVPFAAIGLRSYVFYVPCFYLGAQAARDRVAAERLLSFGIIATAIVGYLTIFAHYGLVPHGASLSPISDEVAKHTFTGAGGDVTLESGIFALAERMARYSLFALILSIALRNRSVFAKRWLWHFALVGSAAGLFIAQRRAPWILLLLGLLVMSALAQRRLSLRIRRIAVAAVVLLSLAVIVGGSTQFAFAFSMVDELGSRGSSLSDVPAGVPLLVGAGIGRFSQGRHQLGADTADAPGVEGGIPKLLAEAGVPGVVLYLLLVGSLVAAALRWAQTSHDDVNAAIASIAVVMVVWFLKGHMILGDSQTLLTLFILLGFARSLALSASPTRSDLDAADAAKLSP